VKAKGLKQELHGLMAGVVHGAAAAAYADAVKKQSAVERPACRIPAGTRGRRGGL
jgi:hypothetical protein